MASRGAASESISPALPFSAFIFAPSLIRLLGGLSNVKGDGQFPL